MAFGLFLLSITSKCYCPDLRGQLQDSVFRLSRVQKPDDRSKRLFRQFISPYVLNLAMPENSSKIWDYVLCNRTIYCIDQHYTTWEDYSYFSPSLQFDQI